MNDFPVYRPKKKTRILIYKEVLNSLKIEMQYKNSSRGLCVIIRSITTIYYCPNDRKFSMSAFPEFINNRPKEKRYLIFPTIFGVYWWNEYDKEIRYKYVENLIKELST